MIKNILLLITTIIIVNSCSIIKPKIKVMTHNVRLSGFGIDDFDDGINAWDNRKEAMVRFLNNEKLDIFGNQETLPDQIDYLKANLPDYEVVGVGRDDGKLKGEQCNIFYKKDRFNLLDSGTFWLSTTPEIVASVGWDADITRVASYVRLEDKISKKKILVFNTHFDHIGVVARQESVKLLAKKSLEISGEKNSDAVIIMGDLNFERSDKVAYDVISNLYSDAKIVSKTKPIGENYTYNGWGLDPSSLKEIDYIFVNNKVKVNSYEQRLLKEGEQYISDHNAVISELTLL